MASITAASKRTSEGQGLGAIESERGRQPLPPVHGRVGTGEAGWPDAQFPQFPSDGPFFDIDGAVVLEGLSAAAIRGRRKPRAGSTWAKLPGILGKPTSGRPRPARGRGGTEGGSPSRDAQPTEVGDNPFATSGPEKQSCRAPKDSCLCCKDHSASESAGEDQPALDGQ